MKYLHIDNETNRVVYTSSQPRKSLLLGPKRVTVVQYVGPFIDGLEGDACINLVCNVDTLKFVSDFSNEANKVRLLAWNAAYVSFYGKVDEIKKDYVGPMTPEQTTERTSRFKEARDAVVETMNLPAPNAPQ